MSEYKQWWLFEPKSERRKGTMAYVRVASGEYKNEYPRPSSPWMRILPPLKVMLVSDHDLAIRKLKKENEILRDQRNEKDIFICKSAGLGESHQKRRREEMDTKIKNELEKIK